MPDFDGPAERPGPPSLPQLQQRSALAPGPAHAAGHHALRGGRRRVRPVGPDPAVSRRAPAPRTTGRPSASRLGFVALIGASLFSRAGSRSARSPHIRGHLGRRVRGAGAGLRLSQRDQRGGPAPARRPGCRPMRPPAGPQGHGAWARTASGGYSVIGEVNGQKVAFAVDTGATRHRAQP